MTRADLSVIPDLHARIVADDDFWKAVDARKSAHQALRYRLPGWRLDHMLEMRRALRAWKHYAEAVRAAQ